MILAIKKIYIFTNYNNYVKYDLITVITIYKYIYLLKQ